GRIILEASRGKSYCRVTISQRSTPHSSIRLYGWKEPLQSN
nr:hypothetical protein [Tanacetum cinerariifolium]